MKKGTGWPIGVAVALTAVVGVNIWVAFIANDDPSFSIEPNYYQTAVAWDSAMAQARANNTLGWTLTPTLSAFAPSRGATLTVRVTDSAGALIRDAHINVTAFFNARASTLHTATLVDNGSSGYSVSIPVDRAGEWEFRFDVTRGNDRFTTSSRINTISSVP